MGLFSLHVPSVSVVLFCSCSFALDMLLSSLGSLFIQNISGSTYQVTGSIPGTVLFEMMVFIF